MLTLIAGQGQLPRHLVDTSETRPLVASLARFPPDTLTPDVTFRIETLGSFLGVLKEKGVTDVCFAGSLRRQPIEPAEIDEATAPYVPRMAEALKQGDDAALRTVLEIFEEAGFQVKAAHELSGDLLPEAGVLTETPPTEADKADAARAFQVLSVLGPADVGQGCVVSRRQVLAVEASYGTDWMLASLEHRPDTSTGGTFYKAPKPDQDRRIDLPAIGPETVHAAADAGLYGIAIEAGGVMVLDRETVVDLADKLGLFIWVRDA